MDLGTAAEGMGQLGLAMLLEASLLLHLLAAIVARIGLATGVRAGRVLATLAVALVVVNHVGLVYVGAWRGVMLGSAEVWPVVLAAFSAYIVYVAVRAWRRRPSVA